MKRLWIMLAIVLIFGFTVLGWIGSRICQHMPPIPERIVTSDGRVVASDGASVEHGYWYARSSEFLDQGLLQTLRWMRMPGDTLFAIGAIGFVILVFGLGFGYSLVDRGRPTSRARTRIDTRTDIDAPRELEPVSGRAVRTERLR